ncbi:MAG: hypothetical protein HPZ91_11740 [Lentisphaeria bacterium]|nr:hypothetical protein [Lentisphaeria bacterium]
MLNWKKLSAAVPGLLLLAGALAMNAGCRSDAYYQDRAVQRAREYLLENAPELTAEQLYFVKYNRPLLLTGDILPAVVGPGTATGELKQICVTWRIPGRVDDYLVYGASSGSMQYWYPNRLIRKTFRKFSLPIDSAMTQARAYSQNYLYGQLGVAEFNRVRFDFPYVIETTFTPVFNPSGSLDPEEVEELKAALEAKTQLSLVWKVGDTGECVVFCGYGRGDLAGWAINFGGKMRQSEVDAATVRVLKTPDDAQTPIELPEKNDGEEPGTSLVPEPVVKPPVEQKEAGPDA